MTSLEKMKDELKHYSVLCVASYTCKYGKGCLTKRCSDCEFYNNVDECIDALLSEYKEPVKLKKWEYDMIRTNDMSHNHEFWFFGTYRKMKSAGYFKGVHNVKMTLKEILENCEIEDEIQVKKS